MSSSVHIKINRRLPVLGHVIDAIIDRTTCTFNTQDNGAVVDHFYRGDEYTVDDSRFLLPEDLRPEFEAAITKVMRPRLRLVTLHGRTLP